MRPYPIAGDEPLIKLRGIRKSYGNHGNHQPDIEVLHDIDLSIYAGEFVAIVGASGSGKSTLMHIMGCLDKASGGDYYFSGQNVATMDPDELAALRRETFGFVFQNYHLIASDTARENVEVPAIYAGLDPVIRKQRATQLLSRLGLQDKLSNRPNQLSGGQQQRISIARALMNGGQVLLADEPTGALDSKSGHEVLVLLKELAGEGHTIILITHDAEVARQAQRIIEIKDGAIVSDQLNKELYPTGSERRLPRKASDVIAEKTALRRKSQHSQGNFGESARSAWRGMRLNPMRTALTLLGVMIGVASVIVMLAIGEGARRTVLSQMGTMGTTIMYLGSWGSPSGLPPGKITEQDLHAISELPEISQVMPVIGDPIMVRYGSQDRNIYVFAGNSNMPSIHQWQMSAGRFFTDREDNSLAPVVVVGHQVNKEMFSGNNPIGKQLLIGNSTFEVIGVMAERGADSGSQDYDKMVFIPYQSGRARVYQNKDEPDYVVVEAASSELVMRAEHNMRKLLKARHNNREDFSIGNAAARLQAEIASRSSMTLMLGMIAAVSLVVGGIGIMNVMLMTVKERTREIGIRMATGARQRDILKQFLTEAMLVTLVGGIVGVITGVATGIALIMLGVAIVFSITAILGAFLCALLTGIVFGYMPAKTAAKLDPVVALER